MLVLRGTKKLRDRVKGPAAIDGDESTTVLGDWFATALFWKPQVALLVNQRTLLPVFVPLAPAATLIKRIPGAIAAALRRQGAPEDFIAAELAAMGEVRIAPTNDRSTVGVMNEFAFHGEWVYRERLPDLDDLGYQMSELLLGPLRNGEGSPDRELAALLNSGPSNVVPLHRTSAPPAARSGATPDVFQLKVTLLNTKPPIWRRILVDPTTSLDTLHEYIQAAFGWWNCHLYEFEIGRTSYGVPDLDWDLGPPVKHARRFTLNRVAKVGDSFRYSYDFGDGWEHKVTIEQSIQREPGMIVPACVDGRRACPPEDCGGPWGYEELLKIVADPSHPEHVERMQWLEEWGGGRRDPNAFDRTDFTFNLTAIRATALE